MSLSAWRGWLLLPDGPPSPLLALGFIRNREDLLDRTLGELGVEAGGLGSALRLARMNLASFGLYGEFGDAPPEINADVLRGTGMPASSWSRSRATPRSSWGCCGDVSPQRRGSKR